MEQSCIRRTTNETDISVQLAPRGAAGAIRTGIGFFDHMLHAFAVHGGFSLAVEAKGDLFVDCHHTVEDTGIVLGDAFAQMLGGKNGLARFGSAYVPMDEALCFCALDLSGRPFLVFDAPMPQAVIGQYDACMTGEFFRAFSVHAGITLHIKCLYGENSHHITEGIFKAVARALRQAMEQTGEGVLSTKGVL